MYINPIIFGIAATIGGECVLFCAGLAFTLRRSGLTLGSIIKAAQSFASVWGESQDKAGK